MYVVCMYGVPGGVVAENTQVCQHDAVGAAPHIDPVYMSRKVESFERINSIRETNENFDSCNSCKRLRFFSAHIYGVNIAAL